MLKGDLHIHSTISDGSMTVDEIINKSIKLGLDVIAITDHDTLEHRKLIKENNDINIILGIEISAIDSIKNIKAHILGYNIENIEKIENFTRATLERRHTNSLKQIKILQDMGYKINIDKLNKANDKYIYKQHIMEQLYKSEQVDDMFGKFYNDIFKNNGVCDFDIEYVDVRDAVRIITEAGGQAVLAHSGQQQNFYLIDELVDIGLAGLEYNHHANSDTDKKVILEYAKKYNLFLTGGSDYHGENDKILNEIGQILSEETGLIEVISKK